MFKQNFVRVEDVIQSVHLAAELRRHHDEEEGGARLLSNGHTPAPPASSTHQTVLEAHTSPSSSQLLFDDACTPEALRQVLQSLHFVVPSFCPAKGSAVLENSSVAPSDGVGEKEMSGSTATTTTTTMTTTTILLRPNDHHNHAVPPPPVAVAVPSTKPLQTFLCRNFARHGVCHGTASSNARKDAVGDTSASVTAVVGVRRGPHCPAIHHRPAAYETTTTTTPPSLSCCCSYLHVRPDDVLEVLATLVQCGFGFVQCCSDFQYKREGCDRVPIHAAGADHLRRCPVDGAPPSAKVEEDSIFSPPSTATTTIHNNTSNNAATALSANPFHPKDSVVHNFGSFVATDAGSTSSNSLTSTPPPPRPPLATEPHSVLSSLSFSSSSSSSCSNLSLFVSQKSVSSVPPFASAALSAPLTASSSSLSAPPIFPQQGKMFSSCKFLHLTHEEESRLLQLSPPAALAAREKYEGLSHHSVFFDMGRGSLCRLFLVGRCKRSAAGCKYRHVVGETIEQPQQDKQLRQNEHNDDNPHSHRHNSTHNRNNKHRSSLSSVVDPLLVGMSPNRAADSHSYPPHHQSHHPYQDHDDASLHHHCNVKKEGGAAAVEGARRPLVVATDRSPPPRTLRNGNNSSSHLEQQSHKNKQQQHQQQQQSTQQPHPATRTMMETIRTPTTMTMSTISSNGQQQPYQHHREVWHNNVVAKTNKTKEGEQFTQDERDPLLLLHAPTFVSVGRNETRFKPNNNNNNNNNCIRRKRPTVPPPPPSPSPPPSAPLRFASPLGDFLISLGDQEREALREVRLALLKLTPPPPSHSLA